MIFRITISRNIMRDYIYYSFSKYTDLFIKYLLYIYLYLFISSYNIYIKFYMNLILNAERKVIDFLIWYLPKTQFLLFL